MKYFTKQWYRDTILAEICFQMRSSSKAEQFSEKYFASLYEAQKKWFVKNEKRIAKHTKSQFDPAAAEAAFEENYNENLAFIKENLPAEILEKVADVRVLAMGSAGYDVLHAVTRFCGQVNRRCEAVKDQYDGEVEKLAEKMGWDKINALNMLSNAPIGSIEMREDGCCVIKTTAEYTDIACKVTLFSAKVALCDPSLVGATVLHHELLPSEDGLELNLLCQTPDFKSAEFSAVMEDLDIEEIFGNQ